eukprot:3203456-Rhodomonas_salina.2
MSERNHAGCACHVLCMSRAITEKARHPHIDSTAHQNHSGSNWTAWTCKETRRRESENSEGTRRL